MAGHTCTNTLILEFCDSSCSANDLTTIRRISNSLVGNRMLVERLAIEPGNAVLSVFFTTYDPKRLWKKIQQEIYDRAEFGERLYAVSTAQWQGEDYLKDHLWIHRGTDTTGIDDFDCRIQCETCEKHFHSRYAKSSLCPYCNNVVTVLL